jgi:hypothetical protein
LTTLVGAGVAVECVGELELDAVEVEVSAVRKVNGVGAVDVVSAIQRCFRIESATKDELAVITFDGAGDAVAGVEELLDEVGLVVGAVENRHMVGLVHGAAGLVLGAVGIVHVVELAIDAVGVVHEVERWLRIESAADVLVAAAALDETGVAVRCAREVPGFGAVGLVVRAVEKVHAVKLMVSAVGIVSAGERYLRIESAAAVEVAMATRGGAGVGVESAAELLGRDA